MVLLLLLAVPHGPAPVQLDWDFRWGLADIAAASVARAAALSGTYAYGTRRQYLRCGGGAAV